MTEKFKPTRCPFYITVSYIEYDCKFLSNKRKWGVELFYCNQNSILKKYIDNNTKMLSCRDCRYLEEIE
jgi:hypothetical protein